MAKPSLPPKKPSWSDTMRNVAPYMYMGWTLVVSILLGVWVGRWADARFGTEPLLFILGAVLGIVVGLYHFLATALRHK
jgi:F0F1-type ATP synthase assembly protein I